MGQAGSGFVGRENEMTALLSALQGLDAGQGRLLMLVGPPGIGKTRIAQEAVSRAQHLGALTLWGRCPEERGAPPLLALGADHSLIHRGSRR